MLGTVITNPHNITDVRVITCDFNTELHALNNILDGNFKEKIRKVRFKISAESQHSLFPAPKVQAQRKHKWPP